MADDPVTTSAAGSERVMPQPIYDNDLQGDWKDAREVVSARMMQAHPSWFKHLALKTRDTDECRYAVDTLAGATLHALRSAGFRVVHDAD